MSLFDRLSNEFGDAVRAPAPADTLDGLTPQAVVAPRDETAAQEFARFCGTEKLAVIPRGGGTKWHIGALPTRFDAVVSPEHLSAVVEHDVGNATVSAGAGITLAALDKIVGENGQFVPLNGLHTGATLGGVAATNHTGATKTRYGAPRDLVVGLSAVLSDGRLVKAGGKVVKNVSGYDLNKLFIGSFGSLGLITGVILRLRPHDETRAEWSAHFASLPEAEKTIAQILDGAFEPAILRLESASDGFVLRARFDGVGAATAAQLGRLPQSQDIPVTKIEPFASPDITAPDAVTVRATLPLRAGAHWVRLLQQHSATAIAWDCGYGAARAAFASVPDISVLRSGAEKLGGHLIVEYAPAKTKTPDFVWGSPPSSYGLMRGLKGAFDPENVFAPGRFIGGL